MENRDGADGNGEQEIAQGLGDPEVWRRAPDVLWRQLADGVIVLSPGDTDDQPTFVQASGAIMWELLATRTTVPDMVSILADIYDVNPSVVRADLEPVLLALEGRGAVERIPSATDPPRS